MIFQRRVNPELFGGRIYADWLRIADACRLSGWLGESLCGSM
jgi:hypothetical protein